MVQCAHTVFWVCVCGGGNRQQYQQQQQYDDKFRVPALDLLFADGRGGSLADRKQVDGDAGGIGSGFFGKICAFTLNGAMVAVKELKTGSLDAASIRSC